MDEGRGLFGDLFGTQEMRAVFSDDALVQRWLDVEAALAQAQAAEGLIPVAAAAEIARVARVELVDIAELRAGIAATRHPFVPAVRALAARCDGDAGGYVHWGATTQDVMDTAAVLQLKAALVLVERRLDALLAALGRLAAETRDVLAVGRTHCQHALPITFGFKVATWAAELLRHRERLLQARPRVLVGQLSGGVGSLASFGEHGLALQRRLCDALGLGVPPVAWHASRDGVAEVAWLLAATSATCSRIAQEVVHLQKTEVGEVLEPHDDGNVGSSTMPQKRNPHLSESVLAAARLARQALPVAVECMVGEHERDMGAWQAEWEYVPTACLYADAALAQTVELVAGLRVDPERMRKNLAITGSMLMAEPVMLELGRHIGRQRAHDRIHAISMRVLLDGRSFVDALLDDAEVAKALGGRERIERLVMPERYTGRCGDAVDEVVARLREVVSWA